MEQDLDPRGGAAIGENRLPLEPEFLFEPNDEIFNSGGNAQAGDCSVAGGPDLEIVCKAGNRG